MLKINELLKAASGKLSCGKAQGCILGISIDSRTTKPGECFVAIKGDNFDGHDFIGQAVDRGASVIVHSPQSKVQSETGNRAAFIAVKDTLKALGDIARYLRQKYATPVIAVTGSNGKTTTKEMIAHVLSSRFKVLKNEGTKNNAIGLPMTLQKLDETYDFAVVEIGTNHFGEVEYLAGICRPNIGVITNIGHSHIEFFNSLKGVLKEKCALINNLSNPRIAILNTDDSRLKRKAQERRRKRLSFGIGILHNTDFFASDIKVSNEKTQFLVNGKFKFVLKTPGYHNIYNALTAIAAGRICGLGYGEISEALSVFDFPQGRLSLLDLKDVKFINDTYNSNPLSLKHALETLDNFTVKGRKIFVMGDMLELGEDKESFHIQAGARIAQVCDAFISVGKLSALAAEEAKSAGFDIKNIFTCESSRQARDILLKKVSPVPDDIVLVKGSRSMKMEEVFKI